MNPTITFAADEIAFPRRRVPMDLAPGYEGIQARPDPEPFEDAALSATLSGLALSEPDLDLAVKSVAKVLERPDLFAVMQARIAAVRMVRRHVDIARLHASVETAKNTRVAGNIRRMIRSEEAALRTDALFVMRMLAERARVLTRPTGKASSVKETRVSKEEAAAMVSDFAKFAAEKVSGEQRIDDAGDDAPDG